MKKTLLFLSVVAMLTACGQKEEAAKAEEATPVVVEQVVEEVSPAAIEETIAVEEAAPTEEAAPATK